MRLKETNKILDDFEHSVTNRIRACEGRTGFPVMEDYGITRAELDSYLFDKQAIIDSEGSERTRYTWVGILMVIPIVVMSTIPEDNLPLGRWTIIIAILVGLLLCLIKWCIVKVMIRTKLNKISNPSIDRYIDDVLNYQL
ncbi:hypothetical protein [Segatella bryantii]|jgi:hypothetical protein|uniref:hypothetical protein n=1 Tax=Segatella bryantii TaxID=77095 RepID=UPI00285323BC|nr:hypothetical protein [Segatella bryantii]MDR4930763.1 hypothetical protein [Segatella bryantii]